MLKIVFLLVTISAVLCAVQGYPDALFNGAARTSACGYLKPNHGVGAQSGRCPYTLEVNSPYWIPNDRLRLTLKGRDGNTFRGFMIQARSRRNYEKMVGNFVPVEGTKVNCEGNRALSHSNNDDKHYLHFTWNAPSRVLAGDIQFLYTVVENKGRYWVNQTSDYIPTYYDYIARPKTTSSSYHDDDYRDDDHDTAGSGRITAGLCLLIAALARLI